MKIKTGIEIGTVEMNDEFVPVIIVNIDDEELTFVMEGAVATFNESRAIGEKVVEIIEQSFGEKFKVIDKYKEPKTDGAGE